MSYTLSKQGDGAKISVVNKGDSIASEAAQVLFNPFKHQSLSNERNKAGMGLGCLSQKK